jgi:hypothetical protein
MHVIGVGAVALMLLQQVTISGRTSGSFTVPSQHATTISSVVSSASASSIVATWQTSYAVGSRLACGTADGVYEIAAVDTSDSQTLTHQSIVAGLQAGTTYYCQVSSTMGSQTVTSTFSVATTAEQPSTPITGLSLGAISLYDNISAANQMWGDTYYNCKSNDGTTYLTSDDTTGWQESGAGSSHFSALELAKFTSESPLAGITVNPLVAYGPASVGTGDDNRSEKSSGLFCMNGKIFMAVGRQTNAATGGMGTATAYMQYSGQVIASGDKGASWNNFQSPTTFNASGSVTSPASASIFGTTPTNMASATFVMYCADDGTIGYLSACNRHDNADAYVYLMANDGYWDSGNALYLARVPRAKLAELSAADYQFYTGGDGRLDSSWGAQTSAAEVISNAGKLGEPNVQYVPALNRYLLLTFSYPQGLATSDSHPEHTQWLGYEAPHPWGPWTLISSTDWPTQGYYNPIVLNDTIYSGTTPTIMFTGNFMVAPVYDMFFSTITIEHQ